MSELLTPEQMEQAAYLYALGLLPGIGLKSVLDIVRKFPQLQLLPALSQAELAIVLPAPLAKKLGEGLTTEWKNVFARAQQAINQHLEKGISPLPITSHEYPVLLMLIDDPPPILYVKGDRAILNNVPTVAIIGTREATARGLETTRTIAYQCARRGCVVVSGLARGTDTAAHWGAIDAGGKTISVLANSLDKVYPAENKKLADKIWQEAGVLVSEYPIGTETRKGFFVARDRIQSGISLGVIPVQTDIDGGTMHTIRAAREQQRPIFCPLPPEEEKQHEKYRGILSLLNQMHTEEHIDKTKRAINRFPFNNPRIYDRFLMRLEEQRLRLLRGRKAFIPQPQGSSTMQTLPSSPTISMQGQTDQAASEQPPTLPTQVSESQLIGQPPFVVEPADSNIPNGVDTNAWSDMTCRDNTINAPTITHDTGVIRPAASLVSVELSSPILAPPESISLSETSVRTATSAVESVVMDTLEVAQAETASESTAVIKTTKLTLHFESEDSLTQLTSPQEATEVSYIGAAEMSSGTPDAAGTNFMEADLAAQAGQRMPLAEIQEAAMVTSPESVEASPSTNDQSSTPSNGEWVADTKPVDLQEEQASATNKPEEQDKSLFAGHDPSSDSQHKFSPTLSSQSKTRSSSSGRKADSGQKRRNRGQQPTGLLMQGISSATEPEASRPRTIETVLKTTDVGPSNNDWNAVSGEENNTACAASDGKQEEQVDSTLQRKKRKKKTADVPVEISNRRQTALSTQSQSGTDNIVPRSRGKNREEQEGPKLWEGSNASTSTL